MTSEKMDEIYEVALKVMDNQDIEDTPINRFWVLIAFRDGIKQVREEEGSLSISDTMDEILYLLALDFEIGSLSRQITLKDAE